MPGYVMHLAVAECVLADCRIRDERFVNEFRLGSIAPDIIKGDGKRQSHFWSDEEFVKFVRKPDTDAFLEKYGKNNRMAEPFVFGYYAHLYLDRNFIERYWAEHFEFYDNNMKPEENFERVGRVLLRDNGRVYDRAEFFSEEYYYGDYSRMNGYMLEKYHVRAPHYTSPEDITAGIEELCMAEGERELISMLHFLNTVQGTCSMDTPKVFCLEEMDKLLAETAKELADQLRNIIGLSF